MSALNLLVAFKMMPATDVARLRLANRVAHCFSLMGATKEQVAAEKRRLLRDDLYLEEWLHTIDLPDSPTLWQKGLDLLRSIIPSNMLSA